MTPFFSDGQVTLLLGHVMDRLRELTDESVQCVITSPPYWALRAYGTEPQVWGGDPEHGHTWGSYVVPGQSGGTASAKVQIKGQENFQIVPPGVAATCPCGAWRGELGHEPTPQMFVSHLVEVFREIKRVLKTDGTCWVNLGDSYAGSGKGPTGHNGIGDQEQRQGFTGNPDRFKTSTLGDGQSTNLAQNGKQPSAPGLRAKSLVLIPERFALAMADDGWIVRSRIAWTKASPMPESVRDRPVNAWEHVFMFTKSPRYYFDQDAIRERGHAPWNYWHLGPDPSKALKSSKLVRVSADDADDDSERIVSSDCPVHGDPQASMGSHDGLQSDHLSHTEHNENGHAQEQLSAHVPNQDQSSAAAPREPSGAPFETAHNTSASKTAPHSATNQPYIASAGTSLHTDDIADLRGDESHHHGTSASSTTVDDWNDSRATQTLSGNACTESLGEERAASEPLRDADYIEASSISAEAYDTSAQTTLSNKDTSACTCSYVKLIVTEAAHFAQYPRELVRRCIAAATSEKGECPQCGKSWVRVVETIGRRGHDWNKNNRAGGDRLVVGQSASESAPEIIRQTTGWAPQCACNLPPVPSTVLDPFVGSGTTTMVARSMLRRSIGIDLNETYLRDIALRKNAQMALMP